MDICHRDSELPHELIQHGSLDVSFQLLYIYIEHMNSNLLYGLIQYVFKLDIIVAIY